jgi:hypothetical protein
MKAQYDAEVKRKNMMEEEDRERLKRLRSGEVEKKVEKLSSTVRVDENQKVTNKPVEVKKEVKVTKKAAVKTAKVKKTVTPKSKKLSIDGLDITSRAKKALTDSGIKTVDELKLMDMDGLTALKGIGKKAAEEILKAVK